MVTADLTLSYHGHVTILHVITTHLNAILLSDEKAMANHRTVVLCGRNWINSKHLHVQIKAGILAEMYNFILKCHWLFQITFLTWPNWQHFIDGFLHLGNNYLELIDDYPELPLNLNGCLIGTVKLHVYFISFCGKENV